MIICKYYDLKYEEINEFWKKRENSYLVTLLMKNFKCLNIKRFREEYFELEEKIKENLKNA